MGDGTVGVAQASSPDRLIDNAVVTNDAAQTVYRQKVDINGSLLEELLMELRILVANLAGSLPDTAGRTRVLVDSITGSLTLGTVTTVSTVTSVTNVAQEGSQPANTNVPSLMNIAAYNALRPQIVVS